MKKVIRQGCVCVIYSPGHGAGWFSWHNIEALLYDPTIIEMIDRHADGNEIEEYCQTAYGADGCYLAAGDLTYELVPVDDRFCIHEYDGAESVVLESTFPWIKPI